MDAGVRASQAQPLNAGRASSKDLVCRPAMAALTELELVVSS